MPATLKDIARESGVNVSTVSRSLSGSYGVHAGTRERVLAVAERLNYRPNRVARGLVTGRSNTLALLVSDIRNPFFAEVARGAEDAARATGYDLLLCNSDFDPAKQMDYVRSLHEKRVDGILINSVTALDRKQYEQLVAYEIPIVLLHRPRGPRSAFSSVHCNNEEGGCLAGTHLASLGHRHTAFITGPREHHNLTERGRGFLRAINRAQLPAPVVLHGENSFQGGYELAQRVLRKHPRTTAIFAANDVMAFGTLRACAENGLSVPDDVTLVGFDDLELASVVHPPLTTVHQPKYEMGQAAVEMLLRMSASKGIASPEHRLLGVRLVVRQSSGAPRSEA